MERIITIKCPMALTLFLNIETIEPTLKVKLIKQTVALQNSNIMDYVEIKRDYGLEIKGDIELLEREVFLRSINIFQECTKLKVDNLSIDIKRMCKRFYSTSNIIAGILIGLNEYYHANLTIDELKKLSYKIDKFAPYFLVGGFKKYDEEKEEMVNLPKNLYQSYIIVDKKDNLLLENSNDIKKYGVVNIDYKTNFPYSDYEKLVSNNYNDIKEYLKQYKEFVYSLIGNTSLYVITSKDNLLLSRMNYRLKHEFPNYNFYGVENTSGPKVLIKNS